ncbi:MAG: hypothetical protein HY807_03025 [Nitrospirae bacterium]|nr:hypothetical protein [Nitrospirota bacterium]
MKLRIIISTIAFLAFFSISLGMVIFFNSLRDKTYDEANFMAEELVNDIADDINLHIREYSGILGFVSRQEEFQKAVKSGNAETLSGANRQLDRLCSIMEAMDVCYLMDVNGNTIASSNRNSPDSFVGKNYSFRPYFRQAFSGVPAEYAALGVTSNKRGLYYAYPVYVNKDERPSGVIVIKENIEHLRAAIVKPYEGVMMMTGPNGVIFYSNREDWRYKTLWKVTPEQALEIKGSKQFGEGPWEWSGVIRAKENRVVDSAGKEYHIHQKELRNMPGWQIVYLHDHEKVIGGSGGAVLKKISVLFLAITIFFGLVILYLLRTASLDLSLRKKAVVEQERLGRELEVKNKELQQIVYTVSHDLRSPLINIQGYSRMLADDVQQVVSAFTQDVAAKEGREEAVSIVDKDIPEAVSYIDASISKMDSLLSSMLMFSRSASIELNKAGLDMNVIIREVLNVFDFQMKEAGARCDVSELPSCYGDEQQINQVFSNLIGNSIKFLSPERPGAISISGRKEDGQTVYCVEDNGIGIPLDEQGRIFDIFYRMHNKDVHGQGLGLAIVRKIIERHGGKIWVESEFGKGSKFYVELPGERGKR